MRSRGGRRAGRSAQLALRAQKGEGLTAPALLLSAPRALRRKAALRRGYE